MAIEQSPFCIRQATADDYAIVASLFREYAAGISTDLSYQGFEDELASLPNAYAAPAGAIFLARITDVAVGCVALRPMNAASFCEMKRLHVRVDARGHGLGRALAKKAIERGAQLGYRAIRLDTLPTMHTAQALYEDLGFRIIAPYYDTPVAGTLFMEKSLL